VIVVGSLIALIIGWIGGSMIASGDDAVTRWLGLFVVMIAGGLMFLVIGTATGEIFLPEKERCSQYVWINDELTCVTYGEEG
jgi:hypothetical protein